MTTAQHAVAAVIAPKLRCDCGTCVAIAADAAIAAHLEALAESGHVVVKLPEPSDPDEAEAWRCVAAFDSAVTWPRVDRPISTVWGEELDADEARHYAADLLAAAAKAEADE